MRHPRARLFRFVFAHLLVSGLIALAFLRAFGHRKFAVIMHVTVLAGWDTLLLLVLGSLVAYTPPRRAAWARRACAWLPAATFTFQIYLYALNAIGNTFFGRNITFRLVAAFAPTVLDGTEPFPIGARGIALFAFGTIAIVVLASQLWSGPLYASLRAWLDDPGGASGIGRPLRRRIVAAAVVPVAVTFAAMLAWGIQSDWLLWNTEMIVSFLRPNIVIFEPTARRTIVADRDARLRAAYPRHVGGASRKNVVLIMVDSLRADHMQVYGYGRPTTPFLSGLVESGRMKKVETALSTCSESYCGITSTLSGREFRDISARDFKLQDVLRDQGYQTWFLLSGNHRAWYGLTQFYGAGDDTLIDGSQTRRYTMDDDRGVLESLERVPPASSRPAFFYLHLMSTHYMGVQLPESHIYTRPDDEVSPGRDPHQILNLLDKPDRYDDKVTQADGFIRKIFEALAAKHYLDDAMVVVTGDHGEGLGERHWGHGSYLYDEDMRIPLLFYDAPAASYGNLALATQVDIAPTILDRLGLPIPASWAGQSLLAPPVTRYSFHQTYFHPTRYAVVYRSDAAVFKFISTPDTGAEELYDITHDRADAHNLVDEQRTLAGELREKLRAYLAEP
jgi:hypothetical protein